MFDIGTDELLLTAIVAIVVIGPKDLPRALRVAGGWIAKIRRVSGHFRSGIEEMIRQAELEDMEKKWREKNEAIMREEAARAASDTAMVPDQHLPDQHIPGASQHYAEPVPAEFHHADVPPPIEPAPPEPAHEAAPELPLGPPRQS